VRPGVLRPTRLSQGQQRAPRLAEHYGWHDVFGLAALPILCTLVVYLLLAKECPRQPPPQPLRMYLAVLREHDLWHFNLFYMITFGGFVGLASFLTILFYDEYSLSRVAAGNLTALCVCAGSFVRPVGGYLADRFGGIRLLSSLFGMIAVLMFAISRLPALPLATGLLFLSMALLGMGNGVVFQLVPQRFHREIGVVTGLVGATGGLGGFLLPSLLGVLKDVAGSYGAGFLVFGAAALGGALLLSRVQHTWQRSWAIPASATVLTAVGD
jgi:NNP family nitrate/nitrite transporter-like MFS transporter